ncbi:tissue alpha-L-fucosidase [Teratosphaeria nubilosa]|uniref:alpha-L-fucosidase n=1 Tax=Teratosphaeria nubilosa TaxID=161662 RepID=A0A6G1L9P3_9PEZI|nr:tissue alpha-L-fucosidase [Teratosphaeria nubilosa]
MKLQAILPALVVGVAATAVKRSISIPLDLSSYYNNKAFGSYPGEAAFDPLNQSYAAPALPINTGSYRSVSTGIEYNFHGYCKGDYDNVICDEQVISPPPAEYFSANFLVASDVEFKAVSGDVTFGYADNTASTFELRSEPWFAFLTINRGEIVSPYRYTADGTNYNTTHIFEVTAALEPGKSLCSITLPSTTNVTTGRLHIFAISLWQGSEVVVQSVRPTQKAAGDGSLVEVTVNNAGTNCVAGDGLKVTISDSGLTTTDEGRIKRLCPGDQKRVFVAVSGSNDGPITVTLDDGNLEQQQFENVSIGLTPWTSDLDNLARHESPQWFNDAKYGIFIHWGPYAVAGWGNSSPFESYAEWFWWYSTHHPQADKSDFYDYRLRTFGPDWKYDDSFEGYTAAQWDPKEWVDLFADAGAKYFVITTKHHDGFSIFDTGTTTDRSALHYGPKRDLLGELFDAAATYQPHLRRGTYFSLPEWFNPSFGPYGFDQLPTSNTVSWPGILAKNPYTGVEEPYTGHIPIDDFITDLMVPQMEILAYKYSTDIMWCDCGAANNSAEFAAAWWNKAAAEGRDVAINSRCGIAAAADFETPEYATFSTAQRRKWESNEGMDPYSYGYNRATAPSSYMNASSLIGYLVDIVSKNGNFLLDIGPKADGTIDETEVANLREAGKWINSHAEAIFNTTYWFVTPESEIGKLRFTQTDEAFYILALDKPAADETFVVNAPLPILGGDIITMVGSGDDTALKWQKGDDGSVQIEVSAEMIEAEQYCWVFKITYTV